MENRLLAHMLDASKDKTGDEPQSPQPEALRLAAWLNEGAWHQMRLDDVEAAGRELRRLHAEAKESLDAFAVSEHLFAAACADLGAINEALGLDPNDGGAEPILDAIEALRKERNELHALINNPQTDEFLSAVRSEAAHQRDRWGQPHDRQKSAENWFWLVGYLSGKALRAAITGDKFKARHHTISSGAALANWFEAIAADESGAGIGQDSDIKPAEEGGREGEHPDASILAAGGAR